MFGMIAAGVGSLLGGAMQSRAAGKAADSQERAAREANALQKEMFETNRQDLAPYRNAGYNALAAMQYEMGLGERPTFGGSSAPSIETVTSTVGGGGGVSDGRGPFGRSYLSNEEGDYWSDFGGGRQRPSGGAVGGGSREVTQYRVGGQTFGSMADAQAYAQANTTDGIEYQGFQATPGYQFRLEEGQNALEKMQAARGTRFGGAALKEFANYNQGQASQEYGNYYNRLAGLAGTGQTAVNTTAGLGANYAGTAGQNMLSAGQAKASGYQNQADAWSGTINSLGNVYGAAKGGYFGANPGFGITPFGG